MLIFEFPAPKIVQSSQQLEVVIVKLAMIILADQCIGNKKRISWTSLLSSFWRRIENKVV